MKLDFDRMRRLLRDFEFRKLFVEELGWSNPSSQRAAPFEVDGETVSRKPVAELAGVPVFEIECSSGEMPESKTRMAIHKTVSQHHHENILIYVDKARSRCVWFWGKREGSRVYPREHLYVRGQTGDLFLSKLGHIFFDISEFDEEGRVSIAKVAQRIQDALNVEPVTKKFYREYQDQHVAFIELIQGIPDEKQRKWYASVLLNRLMFIWFLQGKGFIDNNNIGYLQKNLERSKEQGRDKFFNGFLKLLFFEGFAKPERDRSEEAKRQLGGIKYLNGGLFLPHTVELKYPKLHVPDKAFENLFTLFKRYSWNLNDTPGGEDDEINPDVLGYIFEKYINQKAFGAYYTRPEITEYLCERTIHRLILDAADKIEPGRFTEIGDLLMNLDARLCKALLFDVLPKMSLLDPACGSGAFLVAAMKVLIDVYSAIIGRIPFLKNAELKLWLEDIQRDHKSIGYFIKKRIITDNLFGVDIMEEATEIARLRLFLALVAAAGSVDELEPLPNIDFNILPGNSLIGLLHVDPAKFDEKSGSGGRQEKMSLVTAGGKDDLPGMVIETGKGLSDKERQAEYLRSLRAGRFKKLLEEKNRLIDTYRHASTYGEDLTALRENINAHKKDAGEVLDKLLLDEFNFHGIKFEEAAWDDKKKAQGRSTKRNLTMDDMFALRPFHWGFEFDQIMNERGGFDAIITNPPWEVHQTDDKEFFQEYVPTIKKKVLRIEDWTRQHRQLMKDEELRKAWLAYCSMFPHTSAFFRVAEQYKNQQSFDDSGKRIASKINLFKIFVEQCFNLLRKGGLCGIVIPSGIYTDLGAKQLREMLFSQTEVTGLFGFENRKEIFEGVHRSYKFVVLTFRRGGTTQSFPAAFMRHDVAELEHFPRQGAIDISVELVRRLSPDSLSIMEFKNEMDIRIAEKMLRFPLLGERIEGTWNLKLTQEFNMTSDSHLFKTSPGPGRLPLYEGKVFHQFTSGAVSPKYWLDEKQARAELERDEDAKGASLLDYEQYRLAFRDVAASTNERTFIATVLPRRVFCPHTVSLEDVRSSSLSHESRLFLVSLFNSFCIDFLIRQRVTSHVSFFFVYNLPIPRNIESEYWNSIVIRAARLICTTPEFDDLAKEVGLRSHKDGATDPAERARLRAELDGLVAHLYGLTEEEFAYILTTFPLVEEGVKQAALDAYRALAPKSEDEAAAALIRSGESAKTPRGK